jgi:predicted transposase YdaD
VAKPPSRSRRAPSLDRAYKRLFSHQDLVADLIRGYVSPALAGSLDLASLERCNGSYVSQDLRGRANDIVWRLRVRDDWVYVYLLLEFQSTVDRFMAVRLLGYIALLWQDLIAAKDLGPDGRLPPVLPIVLYNGLQPWNAPIQLRELIASPLAALNAFQPSLSYLFLDENRIPVADGVALRNLVAAIFALEQCATPEAQLQVVGKLRVWLEHRPDLQQAIGVWIETSLMRTRLLTRRRKVSITLSEVESMMSTRILENIKERVAKSRAAGQAEGVAEGLAAGKAEGVAEGLAVGKAEGKAEGMIAAIRSLVEEDVLSIDAARARIKALLKDHHISGKLAAEALRRLG